MTNGSEAWSDERWRESTDTMWAAGCRWLQSWWRETHLKLDAGVRSTTDARLVASMLPLDADPQDTTANFLNDAVRDAVQVRLDEGDHSGIIARDRLFRNLLSSQPACFNLFGPFVRDPNALLPWVRSLDPDGTEVTGVRFEWAPPKEEHFGGGSAFDAFIVYSAGSSPRFLGVECKYAENLSQSSIKVREPYFAFTTEVHGWRQDAAERLDSRKLRQFWLNTLLVQSLVDKKDSLFDSGLSVVVACAADVSAREAIGLVRAELEQPDSWLRWSPYEDVLAALAETADPEWLDNFRTRYLDFAPVKDLLRAGDPRI